LIFFLRIEREASELFHAKSKAIARILDKGNSRFSQSALPSTPKKLFPWWQSNPQQCAIFININQFYGANPV